MANNRKWIGGIIGLLILLMASGVMLSRQARQTAPRVVTTKKPPTKLIWYHMNPPQPDTRMVLRRVNQYLRRKLNATIELRLIDFGNYESKLRTLIAAREEFDLCFTSSFINNYSQNAVKGAFLALDDLLPQYGRNILKLLPAQYIDSIRINGKIYAVPVGKVAATQWAITFNRQYLDQYNLDISGVTQLEDLEPFLQVIKAREPGVVPYATCSANCHAFALPFNRVSEYAPGALYFDNHTHYRLFNDLDSPEYRIYLKLMRRWFRAGYIVADAASRKDISGLKWFSGVTAYVPDIDALLSRQWGVPVLTVPLRYPVLTNKDIGGYMAAISTTSKSPVLTLRLLNLTYTDRYLYNLLVYGVGGYHYTKVSPRIIKYPAGVANNQIRYRIEPDSLGNAWLAYLLSDQDPHLYQAYRRFDAQAVRSPLLGFNFDPQPVMKEIEALTQVAAEFEGPLNTGALDPEFFLPKAIAKYREAGADRVIAEEQRQLNAWLLQTGRSEGN